MSGSTTEEHEELRDYREGLSGRALFFFFFG